MVCNISMKYNVPHYPSEADVQIITIPNGNRPHIINIYTHTHTRPNDVAFIYSFIHFNLLQIERNHFISRLNIHYSETFE